MTGFIAPDNGANHKLNNSVGDLLGINDTVVGLFISEYVARSQIEHIDYYIKHGSEHDIALGGIVTFGVHKSMHKLGTTHFEVIASVLNIPLLRLAIPDDIPKYDPKNESPFKESWVQGNPLVDLYFRRVTIRQDGTAATINPAEI